MGVVRLGCAMWWVRSTLVVTSGGWILGDSQERALRSYGWPETNTRTLKYYGPPNSYLLFYSRFRFLTCFDQRLTAVHMDWSITGRDCLLVGRHDFLFFPLLVSRLMFDQSPTNSFLPLFLHFLRAHGVYRHADRDLRIYLLYRLLVFLSHT